MQSGDPMKDIGKIKNFRNLSRQDRLQAILDTASFLFHRKGYRTTSLGDIVRELGISKAALYHYIESKEELLTLIYKQVYDSAFQQVSIIVAEDLTAVEKLRKIIRMHIKDVLIKNLAMFSVLFNEENQLSAKYYNLVLDWKKQYNKILEGIIREGMAQGSIDDRYPPKLLVFAIVGMCNWLYKWYQEERKWSGEDITRYFIELLEGGYREEKELPLEHEREQEKAFPPPKEEGSAQDLLSSLKVQIRILQNTMERLEETIRKEPEG